MLPQAEELLRSPCDRLKRAAGDDGKGSPAYLEGDAGKVTGECENFGIE